MTEQQQVLTNLIKNRLMVLDLEPVTAVHPRGIKQFMERIVGTTKYLSNVRKLIYDVSFLDLYNHNGKIIDGCFAIDSFLYKIDNWAHIDFPERFQEILDMENPKVKGICFYLDGITYAENVPFIKCDALRDHLLRQRTDGVMWFEVLKIVDAAGNPTLFYPSLKARRLHEEAIREPEKEPRPTPKKVSKPARN